MHKPKVVRTTEKKKCHFYDLEGRFNTLNKLNRPKVNKNVKTAQ